MRCTPSGEVRYPSDLRRSKPALASELPPFVHALIVAALTLSVTAAAQDVAIPDPGDTVALDQGERAPWPGMLMRDADLFAIQSAALTCRLQLASERTLAERILDSRIAQEHARTVAAEASAALHERLWTARTEEYARANAALQASASSPWVSPALWALIGGAVVAAISVALALAFGG